MTVSRSKTMSDRAAHVQRVAEIVSAASSIGVVGHVGPDGDALGSMIGLALAARNAGIEAVASFSEPFVMPDEMSYLDTSVLVPPSEFPKGLDVAVAVDTSVPERVGSLRASMESAASLVVVDHHLSDGSWGDATLIDSSAAATTELVFELLEVLGWPITTEIATALYTGIVTDTGRFQYSNTSPTTHRITADLLERGVATDQIGQSLYESAPFGYYAVAGAVLQRAVFDEAHSFVWSNVTHEDIDSAGVGFHEVDGLIDLVRLADGSEVACLLKVREEGVTKGSLRSRGRIDVSAIAATFGGGGHHNAAGFTSDLAPEAVIARIIDLLP